MKGDEGNWMYKSDGIGARKKFLDSGTCCYMDGVGPEDTKMGIFRHIQKEAGAKIVAMHVVARWNYQQNRWEYKAEKDEKGQERERRNNGFGYVQFRSREEADRALERFGRLRKGEEYGLIKLTKTGREFHIQKITQLYGTGHQDFDLVGPRTVDQSGSQHEFFKAQWWELPPEEWY